MPDLQDLSSPESARPTLRPPSLGGSAGAVSGGRTSNGHADLLAAAAPANGGPHRRPPPSPSSAGPLAGLEDCVIELNSDEEADEAEPPGGSGDGGRRRRMLSPAEAAARYEQGQGRTPGPAQGPVGRGGSGQWGSPALGYPGSGRDMLDDLARSVPGGNAELEAKDREIAEQLQKQEYEEHGQPVSAGVAKWIVAMLLRRQCTGPAANVLWTDPFGVLWEC